MGRERSAIAGAKKWPEAFSCVAAPRSPRRRRISARFSGSTRCPSGRRTTTFRRRSPIGVVRVMRGSTAEDREPSLGPRPDVGQDVKIGHKLALARARDGRDHARLPRRASHAPVPGRGRRLLRMAAGGQVSERSLLRSTRRPPAVRARGALEPLGLARRRGHRVVRHSDAAGASPVRRRPRPHAARPRRPCGTAGSTRERRIPMPRPLLVPRIPELVAFPSSPTSTTRATTTPASALEQHRAAGAVRESSRPIASVLWRVGALTVASPARRPASRRRQRRLRRSAPGPRRSRGARPPRRVRRGSATHAYSTSVSRARRSMRNPGTRVAQLDRRPVAVDHAERLDAAVHAGQLPHDPAQAAPRARVARRTSGSSKSAKLRLRETKPRHERHPHDERVAIDSRGASRVGPRPPARRGRVGLAMATPAACRRSAW